MLGPLALRADPGSYDLCATHSTSLSVPRGWEVIKLPLDAAAGQAQDELLRLADAVREAAGVSEAAGREPTTNSLPPTVVEVGRRGHLTLVADAAPGYLPLR